MKKIIGLAIFLLYFINAYSSTSIYTATVSGHWTHTGSPYLIYNDINISYDSSLIIDPGVDVIFQGAYYFTVYGILSATGTLAQPIRFHKQDTTGWADTTTGIGGWKGFQFASWSPYLGTDNSTFKYCNVYDTKDQLFTTYRPMIISNCNFYHNKSGAISVMVDSAMQTDINHCSFYNNYGQIIICLASDVSACGVIHFRNNLVYDNIPNISAIHCGYATLLVDSNEIYQNRQTDTTNGGALEMYNCKAVISCNKVHDNITLSDGAVSIWQTVADINGNYICNNQAYINTALGSCGHVQGGGGVRVDDEGSTLPSTSSVTIRNNIIANNSTNYNGGGIYAVIANVDIHNNTIVNNVSNEGGIYLSTIAGYNIKVRNNILLNNVSNMLYIGTPDSMNIHFGELDTIVYHHNWTQHSFTSDFHNDNFTITVPYVAADTLTNIISSSPGLVAPTLMADPTESAMTADFRLLSTSACINKGDNTGIIGWEPDFAGNKRIFGGIIDIGAYEYGSGINAIVPVSLQKLSTLSVYPNPASNLIFITLSEAKGTINLNDITGKQVAQQNVNQTLTSIDIHELPKGIYFAVWNDGENIKGVHKIVVQ